MIKAELSEVQRTEAIVQGSGALHLQFNFCHFSTDVAPLCGFLTQIFMRLPCPTPSTGDLHIATCPIEL
jgi:hypothetical protein